MGVTQVGVFRWVTARLIPLLVIANVGCYLFTLWLVEARTPEPFPASMAWRIVTASTLVCLQALWMVWRRRQPLGTAVASLAIWQLAILVCGKEELCVQPGVMLALFLFATETTGTRRRVVIGAGFVVTATVFLVADGPALGAASNVQALLATVASNLALAFATVALPAGAGVWYAQLRNRAERIADLAQQIAAGESARITEAITDERKTLAQELHDTSSAHLTAILALTAAMRDVVAGAGLDAGTRAALERLTGQLYEESDALYQSYERMLENLQQEGRTAAGRPRSGVGQHSLVDLDVLISEYQKVTTAPITLASEQDLSELSHRLGPLRSHTAFHAVQEALNNVRKHAPGARTRITLTDDGESVLLRISNEAPSASLGGSVALGESVAFGSAIRDDAEPAGLGMGLAGLRDRLASVGGILRTGPRRAGGWAVQALLPYPAYAPGSDADPPAPSVPVSLASQALPSSPLASLAFPPSQSFPPEPGPSPQQPQCPPSLQSPSSRHEKALL